MEFPEIFEKIDAYEKAQKQEAEVLGALRGPGDKREIWVADGIAKLKSEEGFEPVDKFKGEQIGRWLSETKGRLTTTAWKAAWSVAKKYQKRLGKAPEAGF